jgi:hypothetical protein
MRTVTLNWTGRVDLNHVDVQAGYTTENDVFVLTLNWSLEHLKLPEDCTIFLELKGTHTTETHRFDLGRLGGGQGHWTESIHRLRNHELIKLRFGVVQGDERGIPIIKAERDRFEPTNAAEKGASRSFLKMVKVQDLAVPWRVHFDDGEPILQITDREDLYQLLRDSSPLFLNSILPDVVRQIFEWLATSEIDRESDVARRWIKYFDGLHCPRGFLSQLHSRGVEDEWEQVMSNSRLVSEEFSKKFKILSQIADTFTSEEN